MLLNTLLVQAGGFEERNHERWMISLVAALDREKWVQCEVSLSRARGSIDLHKGVYCSVTSPLISVRSRTSDTESRPRRRTSWRPRKTLTGCTRGTGGNVNDTSRGRCFASPRRCLVTAAHRLLPTQGGGICREKICSITPLSFHCSCVMLEAPFPVSPDSDSVTHPFHAGGRTGRGLAASGVAGDCNATEKTPLRLSSARPRRQRCGTQAGNVACKFGTTVVSTLNYFPI